MAVSREKFEQGMSYEEFKAGMTRNRERLEETERTVQLSEEDLAFFRDLPEPLDVLALVEDWCGDVIANVPVLVRLAEESGRLNVRFLLRDENLDVMDQYLNQGQFRSIPTFIFFDQEWRELGHWIERPARLTEMQREMREELFATDPLLAGYEPTTSPALLPEEGRARLSQAFSDFRAQNRELSDREVVREIRELIERGLAERDGDSHG